MEKNHIVKFNNNEESSSFFAKNTYDEPNVSLVEGENNVIYNSREYYRKQPFTLEILETGQMNWACASNVSPGIVIYFSKDFGKTWESRRSVSGGNSWTVINVKKGDIIQVKGDNPRYSMKSGDSVVHLGYFSAPQLPFNVSGNIMSLIDSTNFENLDTITEDYCFAKFFNPQTVRCAHNLILPATTLAPYCYHDMFTYCSSLISAPQLPATQLVEGCYGDMFYGCSNLSYAPYLPAIDVDVNKCCENMFYGCGALNYVKSDMVNLDSGTIIGTPWWMKNVSSTGTFVKNELADWTRLGEHSVPYNWTIINEFPREFNQVISSTDEVSGDVFSYQKYLYQWLNKGLEKDGIFEIRNTEYKGYEIKVEKYVYSSYDAIECDVRELHDLGDVYALFPKWGFDVKYNRNNNTYSCSRTGQIHIKFVEK